VQTRHAVLRGSAIRLNASAEMVNDHPAFRLDWMPFAGLHVSGFGVGGVPQTMADMQIRKMLVVHASGLRVSD